LETFATPRDKASPGEPAGGLPRVAIDLALTFDDVLLLPG
jgi:hypothetical protein